MMKLDIEGDEWSLVPTLMASGALCTLGHVYIEYHGADFDRMAHGNVRGVARAGFQVMGGALEDVRRKLNATLVADGRLHKAKCGTVLVSLDDETYLHDRRPWPSGSVCTSAGARESAS